MPYKLAKKQREFQRTRRARLRAEYLADKACVKCGSTEDLELDHIDPAAKIDHKIWSWSEERRAAELAKCQVLCATHHREKSAQDRGQEIGAHGKLHTYNALGCRCDACKEAKRQSRGSYR